MIFFIRKLNGLYFFVYRSVILISPALTVFLWNPIDFSTSIFDNLTLFHDFLFFIVIVLYSSSLIHFISFLFLLYSIVNSETSFSWSVDLFFSHNDSYFIRVICALIMSGLLLNIFVPIILILIDVIFYFVPLNLLFLYLNYFFIKITLKFALFCVLAISNIVLFLRLTFFMLIIVSDWFVPIILEFPLIAKTLNLNPFDAAS